MAILVLRMGPTHLSTDDAPLRGVLVVDDDPSFRRAIARLLSVRGYSVREAESGAQALKELSLPGAPRLVVVDFHMKTMSGPELCRILRTRRPNLYIVLMTAEGGSRALLDAKNAGADAYIKKPFDVEELANRLRAGSASLRAGDSDDPK
jgi:CheY-like chemotaxis protein